MNRALLSTLCIAGILASGLDINVAMERDHGRECLALVGFSEARDQGDIGMAATMQVVLNRVSDPMDRWPKSICEVVMQKGQFIGVEGWNYPRRPSEKDLPVWNRALELADAVIAGTAPELGDCKKATSFDQGGNKKGLVKICQVGNHAFYVEKSNVEIAGK